METERGVEMRNWMIGIMLAISTPALADHGAQLTGPNAAAIQHSFRVTSTLAAYDVDGERGEWSALVAHPILHTGTS